MRRLMVSLMTIVAACGAGSPAEPDAPARAAAVPDRAQSRAAGPAANPDRPSAERPGATPDRERGPADDGEEQPPLDYVGRVILHPSSAERVAVRVALADTEPERARGLMFRRALPEDAGMLFVFERMQHQSFWMENTLIPLDMIFIDDRLRVVGVVHSAEPRTRDAREVDGESLYVLEVNAGFAGRHDVGPGTVARFENVPLAGGDDDDEEMEEE